MIHLLGFIQLYFIVFVAVFVWAMRRSRRRVLTAICAIGSMIVTLFVGDLIARSLPEHYDHGLIAFAVIDLMFLVGAATAYFHSAHTRHAAAIDQAELPSN